MPTPALTLVCLPEGTPPETSPTAAQAHLTALRLTSLGATEHFRTSTRRRRGLRTRTEHGIATGGPIKQLDFDAMRAAAQYEHWQRWTIWNQVVEGTRPAQPYWTFAERHQAGPDKYPLAKAKQEYLAQPRVQTMAVYNALPHRVADLPTAHLEALQMGPQAYTHLGWLSAVPGDRLIGPDGTVLDGHTDELSVRLSYLGEANQLLDELNSDEILVALHTS
jgi:hypothetical protein